VNKISRRACIEGQGCDPEGPCDCRWSLCGRREGEAVFALFGSQSVTCRSCIKASCGAIDGGPPCWLEKGHDGRHSNGMRTWAVKNDRF
jgi:hypothetical protein